MSTTAPWKVGFNTFWWEGLEKEDALKACIDALVEIGYDAVEYKVDSFGPHPNPDAIVKAAAASREAGLEVSDLVILRDIVNPEAVEQGVVDISEAIRICSAAGIKMLNFTVGSAAQVPAATDDEWWIPPTRQDPQAWDIMTGAMEKLVELADTEDVDLVVEACHGKLVQDFGTQLEMIARIDHPRFKLTFDPSHFVLAGQDLGTVIRRFGRRIALVHLKDAAGHPGALGRDFIFPFLGEGYTDWPVLFGALKDIGYTGVLSVEFEAFKFMADVYRNDPVPAARLSKQAADAILEKYAQ